MKTDTSDMIQRSRISLEQVQAGQKQVVDTNRLFQNIQVRSNTVLQYSGEVIRELRQISEQIQQTNGFL